MKTLRQRLFESLARADDNGWPMDEFSAEEITVDVLDADPSMQDVEYDELLPHAVAWRDMR